MADAVNLTQDALKEAVSLGQQIGQPIITEAIHYAIVPNGSKVESLIGLQYPHGKLSDHITQKVSLRDGKSFMKYVEDFRSAETRVFAEPKAAAFTAVVDYHNAIDSGPDFCAHRAEFIMSLDDRWKVWAGSDQKPFSQEAFAEFIEDNVLDIVRPDGATMIEIARELVAKSDMNFASKVTPQNGQVQFSYTETIAANVKGGTMDVPESFTIRIPIFFGEVPIEVGARLRFRITNQKLSFFYKLNQPQQKVDEAFKKSVDEISSGLGTVILLGGLA